MSRKMRVLIKRPDEQFGHVTNISNTLENMQRTVEGYIETIKIAESPDGKPIILVCNEEGKLKELEHNIYLWDEEIVGTFFLCSSDYENLTDLPPTFGMAEWKKMLTEMRWE